MTTHITRAPVPVAGDPVRVTIPRTFLAMMAREIRVMRRNFGSTFMRVVMQPLLFVFVFAYVMPKLGPDGGGGMFAAAAGETTFATILVPGIVASSLIMQGMMAVSFPLMMEIGYERSIEDRVLAPLPVSLLAIQKVVAGAVQAFIAGLLVFPIVMFVHAEGQAPRVHIANWPLFLLMMVLGSLFAAAAGLFLSTVIDIRQMNVIFTLVLLPLTMLGCVYYPWAALHEVRWLQIAVLFNPLVYVSEGLRAVLTPDIEHMAAWAFLTFVVGGTVALCLLAIRTFSRRVLN